MKPRVTHDRHHILYTRRQYESEPFGRKLRENTSLIFDIDRETHDAIHQLCPPVPLLGAYVLQKTHELYIPTYNPTKDIDGLQSAIERATSGPRVHSLERDLGGLAIEAIDKQTSFIYEGIVNSRRIIDLSPTLLNKVTNV